MNKFKYVFLQMILLYSDKEIKNVQSTVNKELDKIHDWLCLHTLSINLTEINFMVFNKYIKLVIP